VRSCLTCGSTWTEGENYCPFDGARLNDVADVEEDAPKVDPWVGQVLDGKYRVSAKLGSGGMGFVYKARHETLGTDFAIKILRDSEAANAEMVERFRREAESATRVGHPGIIRVHDFLVLPSGAHAMVMELLEGADVAQRIARLGRFDVEKAVHLLLEAAEALEAAHRVGVVHRDLKPENLFVTRLADGRQRLKIVDFGLAKMSELERPRVPGQKLTRTGTIFGTPKYMSPEQGMGKPADPRSDVYSLGCIGYEMLTGVPPFDGENYLGIVNQHLFDAPPPFQKANPDIAIPEAVESAIMHALAKKLEDRPQSMEQFAFELSRGAGISLPPQSGTTSSPRPYVLPVPDGTRTARLTPKPGQPDSLFPPPAGGRQRLSVRPPIHEPGASVAPPPKGGLRLDEADVSSRPPPSRTTSFMVPAVLAIVTGLLVIAYFVATR